MGDSKNCLVIGGGIAGATAGYHLAAKGHSVVLLEKTTGPHHKVCGEFISPEGVPFLEEMGIDLDLMGAKKIQTCGYHSKRFSGSIKLPEAAKGISRYLLDEALLKAAEKEGARVVRGVTVTGFEKESGSSGYRVFSTNGEYSAQSLFFATGKTELKKYHVRQGREQSAVGFKIHVRLSKNNQEKLTDSIELFFYKGGYAGLSPIESGKTNLCFILNKKIVQKIGGEFGSVLQYLYDQNPTLKRFMEGAELLFPKPLVVANLPYGYLYRPGLENFSGDTGQAVYYLGDQFAVIPSFTGDGIAIALLSGKLAARSVELKWGDGLYHRGFERTLSSRINIGSLVHKFLQLPLLPEIFVWMANRVPGIGIKIYEKTRCPKYETLLGTTNPNSDPPFFQRPFK